MAASPLARADRKYSELGDPLLKPANVFDFGKLAKAKLDPLAWDYLDEGSDDEISLHANRTRFDDIVIRPHFLINDVSTVDTSITLLGKQLAQPVYLSVTGGKNCFFPNGEQETALAAGISNTMLITGGGISDVLSAGKGPKVWWQFTTAAEFRTRNQMAAYAEKLEDQGCSAISVTVDIYHVSHRERSIHNGFVRNWCQGKGIPRNEKGELVYKPDDVLWTAGDMPKPRPFPTPTWETLQRLREASNLPVVIKGIMTAEDTELAVRNGMSAVIVSNHGARQLDQVGGTIEALPECVKAAGGKIPVLVDGGFRRGTDVFKALALGAAAVGVGRPYLWGLGAFGQRGVARVVEILRAELAADMGMAGTGKISQINRSFVRIRP
ncbi:MAG TPA: alpha-hydroxy acid oxidase [Bryobacteraceae bacterium]|nr:alpha-hydroxy acid oxidase [Bryobacteraceae bacterium]